MELLLSRSSLRFNVCVSTAWLFVCATVYSVVLRMSRLLQPLQGCASTENHLHDATWQSSTHALPGSLTRPRNWRPHYHKKHWKSRLPGRGVQTFPGTCLYSHKTALVVLTSRKGDPKTPTPTQANPPWQAGCLLCETSGPRVCEGLRHCRGSFACTASAQSLSKRLPLSQPDARSLRRFSSSLF